MRNLFSKQFSGGLCQRENHRRGFSQTITIINLLVLIALLTACSPRDGITSTSVVISEDVQIEGEGQKNEVCPQLDSILYELYMMKDPVPTAEQRGFRLKDGKVFVLLVLADEETQIPEGFDLDVGTRSGDQVQVFVPFTQLCDLANTDEVIAIRQPMEPILN